MNVEREAKLLAPPGFTLPDLNGVVRDTTVVAPIRRQLDAVYYDTADLQLARFGVTLRHRSGDRPEWTLKLPDRPAAGVALVRRELGFDGPPDHVPDLACDLVRAYTRSRPLAPVARLRTDRTLVTVRDPEDQPVVDVVDDTVTVYDGEAVADRFHEIEVELRSDDQRGAELVDSVVARLVDAGCRAGPPIPKAIRALGARAQAPPDVVVVDLRPDATIGQLVQHALARSVAQMIRHDSGARLGDDPEDVHQLRVATRRLRSDLRTFARLLDPAWVTALRSELAWLGSQVGAVRDADVLTERLHAEAQGLPEPDAPAVAGLLEHLTQQRNQARAAMLDAMRSARYDTLLDTLADGATRPAFAPNSESARRSAVPLVAKLVRRPWRQLAAAVHAPSVEPSDDELHLVRIAAKRCRYATEAAAPIVGRQARRFADAIAAVQTVLGDHQDAIVTETWLRATAAERPACGVAAGQLIAIQRHQRSQLRKAWPKVWKTASSPKLRKWL